MKKKYVYILPGIPTRVFKSGKEGRQTFNTYEENKLRSTITLTNQCENEQLIATPIKAKFIFYLPYSFEYRPDHVSIVKLFEFANNISENIVYKKDYLLYDVELKKEYSDNPHTKIIISVMDEFKEDYYGKWKQEKKDHKKSKQKKRRFS